MSKIIDGINDAIKMARGETWAVEVLPWGSSEPVHVIQAVGRRDAEQIARGININLNHDKFHTRIVDPTSNSD